MNDQNLNSTLKVAVIQISSTLDYKSNLKKIRSYLESIKEEAVEAVFLPECFYSLSDGSSPSPFLVDGENEHFQNIRALALDFGVYLIGGSVAVRHEGEIRNRAYNFDPSGNLIGKYDKVHLFACDILKDGKRKKVDEGDIYSSGSEPLIIDIKGFKVGVAICFDLRFPNFLLNYYRQNVDLLTFASAFTVPTGKAHWHTLLKARAIEGQCYVIAPGQCGQNHPKVSTFGHSLIVNSWGEILKDAKQEEGVIIETLSKSNIQETRSRIHRDLTPNF